MSIIVYLHKNVPNYGCPMEFEKNIEDIIKSSRTLMLSVEYSFKLNKIGGLSFQSAIITDNMHDRNAYINCHYIMLLGARLFKLDLHLKQFYSFMYRHRCFTMNNKCNSN